MHAGGGLICVHDQREVRIPFPGNIQNSYLEIDFKLTSLFFWLSQSNFFMYRIILAKRFCSLSISEIFHYSIYHIYHDVVLPLFILW